MPITVRAAPYGRPALDALSEVVTDAKSADPMAPVTILVPNNRAGIVARRFLARGAVDGRTGVAALYIATLPRLAEQVAAAGLAPRRPATRPVLASAWRAALDAAPGVFEPVASHPATIRALINAHRELRDLSKSALDVVASSGPLGDSVVSLHRRVTAVLTSEWYDVTDLLHAAARAVRADPSFAQERGRIVLHLPQALTQAEVAFAAALSDAADLTVVAGVTRVRRADAALERTLRQLGAQSIDRAQLPRAPVASRVLHASDSDDEVRCVVREVVARLQSTPADRIAVLYGAAAPYARLLSEQIATAGVRVNGPGTRAVHERALARGLLGVLGLADDDVPRAALFRALADAPAQRFDGFGPVPVARWERVSRDAAVVKGSDWAERLSAYLDAQRTARVTEEDREDPSPSRIDAIQRQMEAVEGLQRFVTSLRDRIGAGLQLTTWSALAEWALELLHDLYGDPERLQFLPPEEQYAAATIESTLRGLGGLDAFEPSASLADLREVLEIELEAALPTVGRFGEGVFVAPLSAAIGFDADVVYAVGLAEDAFPGRLHEDALLPERVRQHTGGELVSLREKLDAQQRHVLAAFEAAPTVVASFPRGDLRRSTQRLPSRFLLPTLRALTADADLAATDWETVSSNGIAGPESYAAELRTTAVLANEQEWRVRAASAGMQLGDETVDAAVALVRARASEAFTRYDGNLIGADGLPDFATSGRLISPTALESYAVCPHAYFMRRLLRVQPLEQPEETVTISPLDIGNLIHESMDDFVSELGDRLPSYGQPWTSDQRLRLRQITVAKAADYERRGLTGHPRLWQRELERILLDLDAMLDDDNDWRRARDARVRDSELTFGKKGTPPVVISVPGGEVHMMGSADKVDQTRDGVLLVTDIKTGSAAKFKVLDDDPVAAGTKLQLPVYAYAARQLLGGKHVEAQYWFVRKDRGKRVSIVLDEALESTYAETLGTLVRSMADGVFPAKAPEKDDYAFVQCEYCNPDNLGHGDLRERWFRIRTDPALRDLVALIDPDALAVVEAGVGS